MTRTNPEKPFQVELVEYERDPGFGCSQRTDETIGFDTLNEARAFITKYNSKNNEKVVPDWYMIARVIPILE